MGKDKLFSKLSSKDYNYQLEKILENKKFSSNVKNLLLSMLYKIEVAYKDYEIIKRNVEDKKTFIEEILNIIKEKCEDIIIVEEDAEEAEELEEEKTKFLVKTLEGKILIRYPNEILLLYTIFRMNNKQIYFEEKYNIIRNSMSMLLNIGENINKVEVLRDFNGWSWNTQTRDIPEVTTNLIFQNLIYLLGIQFVSDWIHKNDNLDYLQLAEDKLNVTYGIENASEILKLIYKISIIIHISKHKVEKSRLIDEKHNVEMELERITNKKELLNEVSKKKKQALKQIKEIDNIINDKYLLEEELAKRNEKRPFYNLILNTTHLTEILNKERRKLLLDIEENNKLLEPKYYVEIKNTLEEQYELLKDIELEDAELEEKKVEYVILVQKEFIKCLYNQIKEITEKEEIINFIYILRYYNLQYMTNQKQIKDVEELQTDMEMLQEQLISKAYELKILNIITKEEATNNTIIKNLLFTKVILLNNIGIELEENNDILEIKIYDADIFEKKIIVPIFNKKEIVMKFNKITRLFN